MRKFATGADAILFGSTSNRINITITTPAASRLITLPDPGATSQLILREVVGGSQTINGTVVFTTISGPATGNLTITNTPGSGKTLIVNTDYMTVTSAELAGQLTLVASGSAGECSMRANSGIVFIGGTNCDIQLGAPTHIHTNSAATIGQTIDYPAAVITTTDATPTTVFPTSFSVVSGRAQGFIARVMVASLNAAAFVDTRCMVKNASGTTTITHFGANSHIDAALAGIIVAWFSTSSTGINFRVTGLAGALIYWSVQMISYNIAGVN